MINSAVARTISDLLHPEKDIIYFIPKYQREYIWGKQNLESLFDDIWLNEEDHFLGSIICINQKKESGEIDRLELIDGQQRMTTLSILFLALYDHLKGFKTRIEDQDELEDFNSDLLNLKYKLILKSDKKTLRLTPSVSGSNKPDYEHLISNEAKLLPNAFSKSSRAGLRMIVRAYRYFVQRLLETEIKKEEEVLLFDLQNSLELLKKINSSIIVKIEVNNYSDAFTLFETLNNRGVPLSPLDLIKNSFLKASEKDSKNSIDDNFNRWNSLIQNLGDDYKVQERFLRHFYNSFKNEKDIEVKGKTKALRSNLINIYDTLIKRDSEKFFNRLYISSEIYNQLIFPENELNSEDVKKKLFDLLNIGGAASYALLLYVFEKFDLDNESKVELIEFLVKFFLRRHITDTPPTRDLDTIFIDIIKQLHNNESYDFDIVKNSIYNLSTYASNNFLTEKLKGKLYDENVGSTRFILCKLEELYNTTKETYTDLWARDAKKNYVWTIEHILPQGYNIPKDWIDMIADGDNEKAKKIHYDLVHTLGNLTLSGYNSKLSNLSFKKKRDRINQEKSYVGYKNGMFLNEDLKNKESWEEKDIKERGEKMVQLIFDYMQ